MPKQVNKVVPKIVQIAPIAIGDATYLFALDDYGLVYKLKLIPYMSSYSWERIPSLPDIDIPKKDNSYV